MIKSRFSLFAVMALALATSAHASTTTIQIGTSSAGFQTTADAYKTTVNAATAGSVAHAISNYDYVYTSQLGETGSNYAFKSITNFGVAAAQAGTWAFNTSIDFGKGGALFVDGVAYDFKSSDLYTPYNSSQTLGTTLTLSAGNHTLALYGLEDCCGGYNSAKYSINGSAFQAFGNADGLNVSAVPEPSTYIMMLGGLGLVGFMSRRRRKSTAA